MLDAAGYPLKDGKRFSLEFTYMAVSPFYAIAKSVAAPGRLVGTAEIPQLPAGIAAAQKGVSYVPQTVVSICTKVREQMFFLHRAHEAEALARSV
jgi:hypothetical protein